MTLPETPMEVTMPPGSVVITPAQMYAEVRVMGQKLDHLVAVVDPAFSTIRDDITQVRSTIDDHESRLRSMDKRLWAAAVIAAGSGAGIAQLIPLLSR